MNQASDRGSVLVEQTSCLVCGSVERVPIAAGTDYDYGTTSITFSFVRCRACGHVYLNPRPRIESAPVIYPTHYYTIAGDHRFGALNLLGKVKDAVVTRRIRSLIEDIPVGSRVLEVGCGDGSLLIAIQRARPDLKLTGLDLKMGEQPRAMLERQGIACIEAPLEDVAFGEAYDLIIMNQLIEHLWDVRRCLEKLRSVLTSGGRVSISTPNVDGYDYVYFREGSWGGYYFPRHLNIFSVSVLAKILAESGFTVVKQEPLVAPLIWVGTARAVWKRNGWRGVGFFRDSNLLLLAVFAAVDGLMIILGFWTSNQQVLAEKKTTPHQ